MDRGIIVDVYLGKNADDYIDKVNRPTLYLKTITGGVLRAPVCSQLLKDYMEWIADSAVRKKIERINVLFRYCPDDAEAVRKLTEKL